MVSNIDVSIVGPNRNIYSSIFSHLYLSFALCIMQGDTYPLRFALPGILSDPSKTPPEPKQHRGQCCMGG